MKSAQKKSPIWNPHITMLLWNPHTMMLNRKLKWNYHLPNFFSYIKAILILKLSFVIIVNMQDYISEQCIDTKNSQQPTWFFCLSRSTFDILPYGNPSWTTSASVQSGGRLRMWTTRDGPLAELCSSFTCTNHQTGITCTKLNISLKNTILKKSCKNEIWCHQTGITKLNIIWKKNPTYHNKNHKWIWQPKIKFQLWWLPFSKI